MAHIQPSEQNKSDVRQQTLNEQERATQNGFGKRPDGEQPAAWQAYWRNLGQSWRAEPEIDQERQKLLEARRAGTPDPHQGIYPLQGLKLDRADVEWLLATHENGNGPVEWSDQAQQRRRGIDLRGAVLSSDPGQSVDLRGLPLSRLQGGVAREDWSGWTRTSKELLTQGAVDLEATDLFGTHLEGACLTAARLKGADLRLAGLDKANLTGAHLEEANLTGAHLEEANLTGAHLEKAYLTGAELTRANLHGACLTGAILFGTQLKEAYLVGAQLEEANLTGAQLEGADLRRARLGRTILSGTLEGCNLAEAILADENGVGPRLAAVQWGAIDLSTIDWSPIKQLDDEYIAYQAKEEDGSQKDALSRLNAFKQALKAYRRLALVLRAQGLTQEAAYFSYRASILQREILRLQIGRKQGAAEQQKRHSQAGALRLSQLSKYLFSWWLDLTSGYGYKPLRSVLTYLLIIIAFACAYAFFDHVALLPDALILSLTAFHGRGLIPAPGSTSVSLLFALEAVVGLLIEICFIVVFTKRFLDR